MASNAELIAQLYIGFYNRAPDPVGLQYWLARVAAGVSIQDIADSFAASPEASENYQFFNDPGADVDGFLGQVYLHVFGRPIDDDGLAYYKARLETGEPAGSVVASILGNADTNTGSPDQAYLQNKVDAGLYWAQQAAKSGVEIYDANGRLTDAADASAHGIIETVTSDPGSVGGSKGGTDDFFHPAEPQPEPEPQPGGGGGGGGPSTSADVANEVELLAAIDDAAIKTINFTADISLNATLVIDRPVTIKGGSHELTAGGGGGDVIQITADNVTLQGLSIDAGASSAYGIKVNPPLDSEARLSGLTLRNVTVEGAGKSGIDLNGVTNSSLINIVSNGSHAGNGITLTDSTNISLIGVTTVGNAWGSIGLYSKGGYFDGIENTDGITILGHTYDEEAGIYAQEHGITTVTGVNIDAWNEAYVVTAGEFTFFFETEGEAIQYATERAKTVAETPDVSKLSSAAHVFDAEPGTLIYHVKYGATVTADDEPTILLGADGGAILTGGDGNDILLGGNGADTITGGAGTNTYISSAGADHYIGTAGENVIFYYASAAHSTYSAADLFEAGGPGGSVQFQFVGEDFAGAAAGYANETISFGGIVITDFSARDATKFFVAEAGDGSVPAAPVVTGEQYSFVYEVGVTVAGGQTGTRLYIDADGNGNFDTDTDMVIEVVGTVGTISPGPGGYFIAPEVL